MNNIAILGTGSVGQALGAKYNELGFNVMIGTRDVSATIAKTEPDIYGNPPFSEWYKANSDVKLGSFDEAALFGEFIFIATKGIHTIGILKEIQSENLAGKIAIDITNPLDFSNGFPPSLIPELSNTNSMGEEIQKAIPSSKVVKTFSTMWCGIMVNPNMVGNGVHINFICGNDASAKSEVIDLIGKLGWQRENILDLGDITASRGVESFLPLWVRMMGALQTPGFNIGLVR